MHNKHTNIIKLIDDLIQAAKDAARHAPCLEGSLAMHRRWLLEELGVEFKDTAPLEGVVMDEDSK